jgi:5,10-methylene-tetrahydrofolate dehydrogenase/methenyl tetrahydrofolate cyclohydrolase
MDKLVVITNNDKPSQLYLNSIKKLCEKESITLCTFSDEEVLENGVTQEMQNAPILVMKPTKLSQELIDECLIAFPYYDLDCVATRTKGFFYNGNSACAPCTAIAVQGMILEKSQILGSGIVVVGRGVGKDIATLLTQLDGTVTLCHGNTYSNILCKSIPNADIIVCAIGKECVFNEYRNYIKPNTRVINVGYNDYSNGENMGNRTARILVERVKGKYPKRS